MEFSTLIPNAIHDIDLNLFEFRLLCHYYIKGECIESVRETASICNMSAGMVSQTRRALERKGLIIFEGSQRQPRIKPKLLLYPEDYPYTNGVNPPPALKRVKVKKIPIPAVLRWQVWERDDFTCQRCGARKHLAVDHINPESLGGKATLENCQTLCRKCNSEKGTRI